MPQAAAAAQQDLRAFIERLPKAELHLHIEGTLEPDLLMALAQRNGVAVPYASVAEAAAARESFADLQDFLDLYIMGMGVLQKEQDFYDLADAYLKRAAAEGVRHTEIMFDPQGHLTRGVPFAEFFPGLQRAVADAPAKHGLTASLIMCFMRDQGAASAADVLEQAAPYLQHIAAVGLDSTERGFPPSLFVDVYERAGELGLKRVAHAGEEGGPENVWSAINDLRVDRVDHGVHSLDDPALLAHLKQTQMALTVCPLSNLCLQVYKGSLEEKLAELVASGVAVTVNSDDPAYFCHRPSGGGYIVANYAFLAQAAGLGPAQLAELAAASFRASFLDETAKRGHIEAVRAALAAHEASVAA